MIKHNTAYDSFQSSLVAHTLMCRPVRGGPGLLHIRYSVGDEY